MKVFTGSELQERENIRNSHQANARGTDVLKAVLKLESIALCQKRQVAADGGDVMLERGRDVAVCYSFLKLRERVGDLEFFLKLDKNLHCGAQ